jgi:hypothetical protein
VRFEIQNLGTISFFGTAVFGTPLAAEKAIVNESENHFDTIDSFEADLGSLNGITAECAFAMGVEWQMFREQLKSGKPFTVLCLPANATRLVKMAERHRRFVEDRPNVFAGWTEIFVGDYLI